MYKFFIMEILIFLIIIVIVLAVIIHFFNKPAIQDKYIVDYDETVDDDYKLSYNANQLLDQKYGKCTTNLGWRPRQSSNFRVYESSSVIVINGDPYKFEEILGFKIVHPNSSDKDVEYSIKTNTGSLLKRAAVGMAVGNVVGAAVGAVTAKKEIKKTNVIDFKKFEEERPYLYIYTSRLDKPLITMRGYACADEEVSALLTAIINRAKTMQESN